MSSTIPTVKPRSDVREPIASKHAYLGPQPSELTAKKQYLILYNLVSLLLWSSLLLRIGATIIYTSGSGIEFLGGSKLTAPSSNISTIYTSSGSFAKWIQTLAILEVVHSIVGLVRAPVMTTATQVASRFLLVWGIVGMFGDSMLVAKSTILETQSLRLNQYVYFGMLMAWGITECIRYSYFVFFLGAGQVPALLSWLRYNTFFMLYPLGISCECMLIYRALPYANGWDERYAWVMKVALVVYVPGSYILYSHMMSQRKRVMKGKQKI